jgi:multimeric flavodoxin WrbA
MKITVINGTEIKGCTHKIKEFFLDELRKNNEITEFYLPKDCPEFCDGCKICIFKSEEKCPHAGYVMPIWNAMIDADLIVFAYPVYVQRCPGQVKTLLDHLAVHWIVHRPKEEMFSKCAAIITQGIGPMNSGAQKDVKTNLQWLGMSDIKTFGCGLMEAVIWKDISEKRRKGIEKKVKSFAKQFVFNPSSEGTRRKVRKTLKHRLLFAMSKFIHKKVLKNENPVSADNKYWIEKGWIKKVN